MKADDFVEQFLAPWNAHDLDGAMAQFTEDCFWEFSRGSQPHGALHQGASAVRVAVSEIFRSIPNVHYQPIHSHHCGDHVIMEILVTGTHRDGTQLNYRACDIVLIRGDKVAGKRSYRKAVE